MAAPLGIKNEIAKNFGQLNADKREFAKYLNVVGNFLLFPKICGRAFEIHNFCLLKE